MAGTDNQIKLLEDFRDRNKFSVTVWNERGLCPSDPYISESLNSGFNDTAEFLIIDVKNNASKRKIRKTIITSMRHCKRLELDTEEKEYAADLFHELAMITEVNIRHRINIFIYGHFLVSFIYLVQGIRPKRKWKTIQQQCEKCDTSFTFQLDKKTLGQNSYWTICQCIVCNTYFLVEQQESAKRIQYQNCIPVEYLSKEEYNHEQAETRLEQVRYFRK